MGAGGARLTSCIALCPEKDHRAKTSGSLGEMADDTSRAESALNESKIDHAQLTGEVVEGFTTRCEETQRKVLV